MLKTLCVRIPGKLYVDFKAISQAHFTSINTTIITALLEYCDRHEERDYNFLRDPKNLDSIYLVGNESKNIYWGWDDGRAKDHE